MASRTQAQLQLNLFPVLASARSGRVETVRRYKTDVVNIVSVDLWNDLLDAAGERGRQLVDEYAARAAENEQRQHEEAAA